jgi:hypothetical protein
MCDNVDFYTFDFIVRERKEKEKREEKKWGKEYIFIFI